MKLLILISILALASSRPQGPTDYHDDQAVQLRENSPKITYLPYYGGAKGQTLKITELSNGTVTLEIIHSFEATEMNSETTTHPSELEMPPLPLRPNIDYGSNIKNIQQTALNIIRLQEVAKRFGQLSQVNEKEYRENLESLSQSAGNLANIQDNDEDDSNISDGVGLSPWFERKKNTKKEKDKKKEEEKRKEDQRKEEEERKKKEEEERKKKEEEKKKEKEEEEKRKEQEKEKEEEEEESDNEDTEGVAVNLPPEDASVAEAKPVGLAVAGIGGVAASKPIATAVVGPGGLAIARPVATAIAGVSPDQALVPIFAGDEGGIKKGSKGGSKEEKKKSGASEYLNRIISKYHQV